MNWLYYLLEANLYLAIFYAAYLLLLRNETFYTANRWYLLITSIVSFVLPVMQISWLKPAEAITQINIINADISFSPTAATKLQATPAPVAFEWTQLIIPFYILGLLLATALFALKLSKLYVLVNKSYKTNFSGYELIEVDEQNTGFSFFKYLFIGQNNNDRQTIITHELVHIRQKHSADIVFFELIKIISWFNPLVYMLQNSLKTVHEYIADEHTANAENDSLTYSSFLLSNAYGLQGPAATNSFFNYNLLKNRIIMLNKPRSGSAARLKYLMILPLTTGMLCMSTLAFSKDYKTLVLFANHNHVEAVIQASNSVKNQADTSLKYPNPDVVKNEFSALTDYLREHIKYPKDALENKRTGSMLISFNVNDKGLTHNVKLMANARSEMDAMAISALTNFSGKLNVTPGTYVVGVDFVTLSKKYVRFPQPAITKKENFIGTVTILGLDKQTKKLQEQSQPAKSKKPGIAKSSQQIPEPKIERIFFKNNDDFDNKAFNKHLSQNIRYPKTDYDNKVTGRVFAQVTTNADNTIKDVRIMRAPSKTLEEEVVKAIKSYKGKLPAKKINNADYTVPISFNLADKDGNMLTEKSIVDNNIPRSDLQEKNTNANNEKVHYSLNEVAITAYLPKS